ncbi:MAG: PEGA domain-containing protein [Ignavibacteria bacterium]|nr:PEGA domain-containing protein [Ignavibacteria bacterium]
MMRAFVIAGAFLCSSLFGQSKPTADSVGTVRIITEPSGADLYIDSLFVGKSPLQSVALAPGSHTIRAFYPSVFAWNAIVTREPFDIFGGDHLEKRLSVGQVMRIQSDPPGGIVHSDGSVIGTTPLYARSHRSSPADLMIRKEGFDSLRIPLSEIKAGFVRVQLSPKSGLGRAVRPADILVGNGAAATDHWLTYASGAASIVSGVASAYLKDRANRNFDSYLRTNNPADLSSTRRLDREAAAALIISQISFALLAYVLLSE